MTWDHGSPELGAIFSQRMIDVFGTPRRPQSQILSQHAHLACSVQEILEQNYFALLNHVFKQTRQDQLCLAGGVALNCAANGKIFERTPFQEVYVQPAAHDAGTSIGAALYVAHQVLRRPRSFIMRHVYYGPEYSQAEISAELEGSGVTHQRLDQDQLLDRTAREIADGKIVGWFQGRMEFGPRALGNRSILADPRHSEIKDVLNLRIKHRESFRPFAPAILEEYLEEYGRGIRGMIR